MTDSPLAETSNEWQPIETAPKDRPIIGWCVHSADPYWLDDGKRLTPYGSHAEGLRHVDDGAHVLVWGGEYSENDWEMGINCHVPAYWFQNGSDYEVVANPTHWMPLPTSEPPNV